MVLNMLVVFFLYFFIGVIAGFGLYLGLGMPPEWAAIAGVLLALCLGQMHLFFARNDSAVDDLEHLLYETRKNVKFLEHKVEVVDARSSVVEETLKTELDSRLDLLVAERKALDLALLGTPKPSAHIPVQTEDDLLPDAATPTYPLRSRFVEAVIEEPVDSQGEEVAQITPAPKTNDNPLNNAVRETILNGRINLQLQKIVSLPQRQVKFYECFSRPQAHDDTIILPRAFLEAVRSGGMGPALDAQTLFRTLAIQRKLANSERRVGLFCNMTAASLLDANALKGLLAQIGSDKDVGRALIFEFTYLEYQQHAESLLPRMQELTALGVRFSLDNVPTLALDCDRLLDYGVRFLKIGVDVFEREAEDLDTRPICFGERMQCEGAQLTDAFARHGISLIIDRVETEEQVARLLDWHIGLAQGFVFAPPKALKPEILKATQPDAAFMTSLAHL